MSKRTKFTLLFLCSLFTMITLYLSLSSQTRLLNFCDKLFLEEMESNFLTMHYTVSDPEKYGIECDEISLGSYDLNTGSKKRWILRKLLTLMTISRSQLPSSLQKSYDLLKYSLHTERAGLDFVLLEEPLVPSIGIQSQLPILLAEYTFHEEADVINYLTLLKCIPEYFDSIIKFE